MSTTLNPGYPSPDNPLGLSPSEVREAKQKEHRAIIKTFTQQPYRNPNEIDLKAIPWGDKYFQWAMICELREVERFRQAASDLDVLARVFGGKSL